MPTTPRGLRGMVTAPHHLAAEAGLAVLRDGGNAVEAMVAAAATIAVVYPHMNGIGGDGFWLIAEPEGSVVGIDAAGPAAAAATPELYAAAGHAAIPTRGPLAALTVAGTVSGWEAALAHAAQWGGRPLPLGRLLEDAIHYGEAGFPVTFSQCRNTAEKRDELAAQPGFAPVFLAEGGAPQAGELCRQPALAASLRRLAAEGLGSFYRGGLARAIAADLSRVGSPVAAADLAAYAARRVEPLSLATRSGRLYNMPPPTQGVASLMILGVAERLGPPTEEGFDLVHRLVEATKQAFRVRNARIADPAAMAAPAETYLSATWLDRLAAEIDLGKARPWPDASLPGDTIWMGVVDGAGRAVSFIQSLYWEFGSGVVLPETGIVWQNRGAGFSLEAGSLNRLTPGRRPLHTLNPALARLADGSTLVYGCMGGEGQPQTQAAVFARHVWLGQSLPRAIAAPRWLLGRSWGAESHTLKLERRFPQALGDALAAAGHPIEWIAELDDLCGHAGAIRRRPSGALEGAADPRSDGAIAAF